MVHNGMYFFHYGDFLYVDYCKLCFFMKTGLLEMFENLQNFYVTKVT